MNLIQYPVECLLNVNFTIACYAEISVLQLLGYGSQSTVREIPGKRSVEFNIFNENRWTQAKLLPSLKRIINMYVYSDIVELSPVGNSLIPIMGFLSIRSSFQETGHWVFNIPMYVRVKENNITTITIKICTETGEEFPIKDGLVTCRLYFRRRPFLA